MLCSIHYYYWDHILVPLSSVLKVITMKAAAMPILLQKWLCSLLIFSSVFLSHRKLTAGVVVVQ